MNTKSTSFYKIAIIDLFLNIVVKFLQCCLVIVITLCKTVGYDDK